MPEFDENRLGTTIVDSAVVVHSALGPGLLERTYQLCLAHELTTRGVQSHSEVKLPLRYRELVIEDAYRVDLLLNDLVVVEVKAR
jgi:GxxExxY protein